MHVPSSISTKHQSFVNYMSCLRRRHRKEELKASKAFVRPVHLPTSRIPVVVFRNLNAYSDLSAFSMLSWLWSMFIFKGHSTVLLVLKFRTFFIRTSNLFLALIQTSEDQGGSFLQRNFGVRNDCHISFVWLDLQVQQNSSSSDI